ncbi:hypothetical protein BKA24_001774 [Microbacterium marinum]|uniref:Uncharacterized protein n=1 Tax=Microbacterium marinum TaxID=421115 RepID=A0A7W7BQS2_9MICO|nr:hypothetical protein [Microbacterium marinum]MBB4667065.1 hypothetical protein [Microbacterium marinum]
MSTPSFTLNIPAAKSGDQIASVLREVADHFAHNIDGLTPPAQSHVVREGAHIVAEWEVSA